MAEKTNKAGCVVNLDVYRRRVRTYIDLHSYSTAMFWADKVVFLSNEDPQDVYWLAQCMYLLKQYHRAAELIRSRGLDKRNTMCYYLAARCLLEAKELPEALQVLSGGMDGVHNTTQSVFLADTHKELQSAILLLKGRVYEEMDNRALAVSCYKEALAKDVHCFEAFEALTQHQMLPAWEEDQVLASMPFAEQCQQPKEETLVRQLYVTRLKKYHSPQESPSWDAMPEALAGNTDLAVCEAERHYYNCNYRDCLRITEEILKKDPYHSACFPVHIACLVDLKKSNKLFYLAHRLVDLYPDNAISWFAVGCYYYLIGKSDPARRYLAKATTLDRLFGPAWLAYGHSFAAENEHDQAMAAYFKASQLMKGCHLPLLYIGLENGLTNNVRLADKFLKQAFEIAPADPFVLHEMGTVAFQNQDYATAEQHFREALQRIRSINGELFPDRWEPLFNNLGHTCRKLGKYQEALSMHHQALVLSPLNASTFAAMGYVHALQGDVLEAVEMFHKALGIRRDDTFSTTMLGSLMQQLMDDTQPFANGGGGEESEPPPVSLPSLAALNLDKTVVAAPLAQQAAASSSSAGTAGGGGDQQQLQSQEPKKEPHPNLVPRILLLDLSPSNVSFEVEMQDTSSTTIE